MTSSLVALLVLGCGLAAVRTAVAPARWLAFVVGIAFVVVLAAAPEVHFAVAPAVQADVSLPSARGDARAELLVAAAKAGPRASDLALAWRAPLAEVAAGGVLGGVAVAPRPLPFDPAEVRLRCLGPATAARPLRLELEAPAAAADWSTDLTVANGADVQRASLAVTHGQAEWSFVPALAGTYHVGLDAALGDRHLHGEGVLVVGEPAKVLVVEPSGTLAAALEAQGVVVERAAALPADFAQRQAIVLGVALPPAQQEAVVRAVEDGLGLFVVAPGFGGDGEPLRGLLPLSLLPVVAAPGDGSAGGQGGEPATSPPPSPPAPADKPPAGDTSGAGPLSQEPIDVDKHAIAMVLVVDRSGSMGNQVAPGETKMSYAKTSAMRTAQALGEGDQVGVVTFGNKGGGRVDLPMTPATDLTAVRAGIEKLNFANEYTFLLSGLRQAHAMLQGVRAAVKHIVVISDGEFDTGEELALRGEANRMRSDDHITVSVISIVDPSTDPQFAVVAANLTADGGGTFFSPTDARTIPSLVSGEVARALQSAGRKPKRGDGDDATAQASPPSPSPHPEPPLPPPPAPSPPPPPGPRTFAVVATAPESPLLQPLPPESWPSLGAVRAGTATLDAMVLLAVADEQGWPVLAFANRGLGRVAAFAADLGGADGVAFRREAGFPARLAMWLSSVLPAIPALAADSALRSAVVSPAAPTPAEMEQLAGLAGAPALLPTTVPAPVPALRRVVAATTSERAVWLGGLLLLLALGERVAASWARRRLAA